MLTHANQFVHAISHYWSHYTGLLRNAGHIVMVSIYHDFINETPTVRGLAADNNNMQSVLMGNMETI